MLKPFLRPVSEDGVWTNACVRRFAMKCGNQWLIQRSFVHRLALPDLALPGLALPGLPLLDLFWAPRSAR